jgi:hypothetical protein
VNECQHTANTSVLECEQRAATVCRAFDPMSEYLNEENIRQPSHDGAAAKTSFLRFGHEKCTDAVQGTEVFGLKPTGREGTSVETMLLTVRNGKVTRIDVGDNSLDLVVYMWDRGWNHPHNVRPDALIRGIDRRSAPRPATV